ncbi:hypothetical protein TNCT_9641 [Trichonephila clavata]|uniref:Uncharacterized protein n=1 Tax=Trichonephila clavata TaxID=2740835 RepID=A0A8X6HK06_TRICU|nr:hypothetical protein TNCT_9641 [Trichonephila clavata]
MSFLMPREKKALDKLGHEPIGSSKEEKNQECIAIFCYSHAYEKKGSLGRKTVKSKAVEHIRAAEAPDAKRARLQTDQVRYSLARAAETPEQYQV